MQISITTDLENKLLKPLLRNFERFGDEAMHAYIANFATGIMKDATIPLGTKAKSQKTGLPQGAGSINRDIHKIAGTPSKAYHILHSKGKPRQAAAIYRTLKQKNLKEANRLNTAFHSPLKLHPTITPAATKPTPTPKPNPAKNLDLIDTPEKIAAALAELQNLRNL